jgi:Phospholipase_D-nuclease N-terminal
VAQIGSLFAYSFPLLSLCVVMLVFAGIFLMIFFIVWCFIDNFRRHDHHGMAKAGWAILILFLPILGALIYIIARPPQADVIVAGDDNVIARAA